MIRIQKGTIKMITRLKNAGRSRRSAVQSVGALPPSSAITSQFRIRLASCFGGILALLLVFAPSQYGAEAKSPAGEPVGQFWRIHWYERGIEYANPAYDARFRVNSPEVVLHPAFGKRVEARENGMMLILAEEDLSLLTAAEFYLEAWGGHPGTANKRVTVNGRSTYFLPRVGTEEMNCTYYYPKIELKISDLVDGHNAFQFALDQGTTFWGHMLVDNACLRVALTNTHPDLAKDGLAGFQTGIRVVASAGSPEAFELSLEAGASVAMIESVDFQGYYFGYDENGDRRTTDWHGFSKARLPVAHLGTAIHEPFRILWDTRMLPSQKDVAARAIVHFKGQTNLVYLTAPVQGLEVPERPASQVTLYSSHDLPKGFWSRANQKQRGTIYLDVSPASVERAELHVNAWTGGAGTVKEYFKLNGHHFPVAEGSKHELMYSRLEVDPTFLRQGLNEIELLSDTEHHGIEVCLPGPCVMGRSKRGANR
jgi:hypothetical protein